MTAGRIIAIIVVILLVVFGIYMIDVDVTDEGALPDVDVNVEAGEMPEVDVETGDIETGTEEVTVEVPTVDIESPEEDAADGDAD